MVPFLRDDEDEELQQATSAAIPGSSVEAEPSGSATMDSGKQKKGSGQFTNLDQYLSVNPNDMGQKVVNKLGEQIGGAEQDFEKQKGQFQSDVEKGTGSYDEGLANRVLKSPTNASTGDIESFKSMRDKGYQGPNAFSGDQSSLRKAKEAADTGQSESGRFALLEDYFKRPDYGRGQQTLDQALVQRDTGAQQGFKAAQERANKSLEKSDQAIPGLNALVDPAMAKTAEANQRAKQSQSGALTQSVDPAQKRLADAMKQYNTLHAPQTKYQGGKIYDRGLAGEAPTLASVMTPEEKARYLALTGIAGEEPSLVKPETQVGGYKEPTVVWQERGPTATLLNSSQGRPFGGSAGPSVLQPEVQQERDQAAQQQAVLEASTEQAKYSGSTSDPTIAQSLGFTWSDRLNAFVAPGVDPFMNIGGGGGGE